MKKKRRMLMGILLAFLGLAILIIYAYVDRFKYDKLMRDGRPIMATIESVTPVSSDDSGNTTIVYTLNVEGKHIKGKEKIDTFYAPQLQPGMEIKIMYIDDKNYTFVF